MYPCYKGIRELFWVKHISYKIDNTLKIKLRIDTDVMGFQDFDNDKTIIITNSETKARLKISYVSLESNLYFFLDTLNSKKVLSIADQFAGQNFYDYSTLKLLSSEDCFQEYGGCGGFNDSSFSKLGTPCLIYDDDGFHK